MPIQNYSDFCGELLKAGFSLAGGGNDEGIFGLLPYGWSDRPVDTPVRWHTGDADTDPWEWRIRVLDEREDIAYAKVFFRKGGYITEEWYPYFLAARREDMCFHEAYMDGLYSHGARRIYEVLRENGPLSLEEIKRRGEFGSKDKPRFDKALIDLQMGLMITVCGRRQKRSKTGKEYGWASTMLCAVEDFWPPQLFQRAKAIRTEEAEAVIRERVYRLNPVADAKRIRKFIYGK